jgi:hypothetical protein
MIADRQLTAPVVMDDAERHRVWHYVAPGKPMQNGFMESFNGSRSSSAVVILASPNRDVVRGWLDIGQSTKTSPDCGYAIKSKPMTASRP